MKYSIHWLLVSSFLYLQWTYADPTLYGRFPIPGSKVKNNTHITHGGYPVSVPIMKALAMVDKTHSALETELRGAFDECHPILSPKPIVSSLSTMALENPCHFQTPLGKSILENFRVTENVGHGAYKTFRLVEDEDRAKFVEVRTYIQDGPSAEESLSRMVHEIKILHKLVGVPYMLQSTGVACGTDFRGHFATQYMSFYSGGDLGKGMPYYNDRGEKLPPKFTLSVDEKFLVARQVCEAMKGMHQRDLAHRDIKPDNIFINRDPASGKFISAILGDIGEAYDPSEPETKWFYPYAGTMEYIPDGFSLPDGKPNLVAYQKQDCWALGQTVLELFAEKSFAFELDDDAKVNAKISEILSGIRPSPASEKLERFLKVSLKTSFNDINPSEVQSACETLAL